MLWEEENGPIPKGYVIIFGDGNRRNFQQDNLILVSKSQLAILNKNQLIQNDAD
ncbi:HNH endonuclease signature motif containing protein [Bacillus cereus]|uniref:HNH endonuclease signature motif containing protein n=1 Tax=Bacillus cereus TaxID=1396 RepID=UPI003F53701B